MTDNQLATYVNIWHGTDKLSMTGAMIEIEVGLSYGHVRRGDRPLEYWMDVIDRREVQGPQVQTRPFSSEVLHPSLI
jgi:hypothetical protein